MGKVSKKKSRRDNRGSRRNNEDMEQSNKKQSTESSSTILSNLNSIDAKKRMSGLSMFSDLLYQNLKNSTAVDKLTSAEILSSLSIRIIDSNNEIRFKTIKCILAIVRCGQKFAEKIADMGVYQNLMNILDEMCSMDISVNINENNEVINDLLSIIKVMNLYTLVHFNTMESLLLLAVRNISSSLESRRIIFAECLLNLSTKISITSQSSRWAKIGTEISTIISTERNTSEYLSVILSSIMVNLMIFLPSTMNQNNNFNILEILIKSLNLLPVQDKNVDPNDPSIKSENSEKVIEGQSIPLDNISTFDVDVKSLILKTAADSLGRYFGEKGRGKEVKSYFDDYYKASLEVAIQLANIVTQVKNSAVEAVVRNSVSTGAPETTEMDGDNVNGGNVSAVGRDLPIGTNAVDETMDTEVANTDNVNTAVLNIDNAKMNTDEIEVSKDGKDGDVDQDMMTENQNEVETEMLSEENMLDALEALVNSLCTSAELAAAQLKDASLGNYIKQTVELMGVIDGLYTKQDEGDNSQNTYLAELLSSVAESLCSFVQYSSVSALKQLGDDS